MTSLSSTILVIEDEPLQTKILTQILKRQGWHPIISHNLVSAFHELSTNPSIHCILADRFLEDGQLSVLANKLETELPSALNIPFILVSASALKDFLVTLPLSLNIIGFTRKPYQNDTLVSLITKAIQNDPDLSTGQTDIQNFRTAPTPKDEDEIARNSRFIWV